MTTKTESQPFILERTFDAPLERVWTAWSEPDQFEKWWGPKGCEVGVVRSGFEPGGTRLYTLKMPEHGMDTFGKMVMLDIEPHRRMHWINAFSDADGGTTRHPLDPSWPEKLDTEITFTETGGKTTIRVQWIPVDASPAEQAKFDESHDACRMGWGGSFDVLEEHLAGIQPFVYERTFDAPKQRVWTAWNEEAEMKKWLAPEGGDFQILSGELKPGSTRHTAIIMPDGSAHYSLMPYRVIEAPDRLEYSTQFSDAEGNVTVHPMEPDWPQDMGTRVTFTESGGRTTLRIEWMPRGATPRQLEVFDAARDNMTMGWDHMLQPLETYLHNQN